MPLITSYLYQNIFTVQLLDYDDPAILNRRNPVVYQRPIQIYRGADNPIVIKFKNQDQKAANIAGLTFSGYVVDYLKGNVVANVAVTVSNVTTATASCVLSSDFINTLPQSRYKLAFLKYDGVHETPAYSDDNYGIYAELIINPGFETDPFTSSTTDYSGNVDLGLI